MTRSGMSNSCRAAISSLTLGREDADADALCSSVAAVAAGAEAIFEVAPADVVDAAADVAEVEVVEWEVAVDAESTCGSRAVLSLGSRSRVSDSRGGGGTPLTSSFGCTPCCFIVL